MKTEDRRKEILEAEITPTPNAEHAARLVRIGNQMDKHALMHCIVVMVSDRPDITQDDRASLALRIGTSMLSETCRPERR